MLNAIVNSGKVRGMKWISVNDRLPQEGEMVLVFDNKWGVEMSWFTCRPFGTEHGGFDERGFAIYEDHHLGKNITHWCLVEPPPGFMLPRRA